MIKPLSMLKTGERGKIVRIEGGMMVIKRLTDLGFVPEQEVEVIRSAPRGPVAIKIKGAVYALGRGIADKIYVEEVHE
ncbi:TPA: ferrous iron transport protein A [bacterium]|jgi:ferrous iron transport protein A|nr:ferrous iron transport protein A [bacterium]HPC78161.1 FeoA family protein [bacterium]HPO81958.1 FeoA family protein [bacterium]